MGVKTITITENAYVTLKSLKLPRESFSEAILRVAKRKSLSEFFGVLSKKTGRYFEKEIKELRKKRNEAHRKRVSYILKEFRR